MNCPNCGNPMGAEDIFCANCGTQLPAPATLPVAPTPYPPEANTPTAPVKKKSKKKIIIITAIVTALAIIAGILSWIFIFSKETVWLLTSEIHYDTNGTPYQKITYSYTDKGLPLEWASDHGGKEKIWNDQLELYDYSWLPYDGEVDQRYEWSYDDEGHMKYYREILGNSDNSSEGLYEYHYDNEGRIETIDCHAANVDGGYSDEVYSRMYYCYDDDGNLIEIYTKRIINDNSLTWWSNDFRYDEGRLIGYTNRSKEACFYYQFDYNDDGQLTEMSLSTASYQARLDDDHVSESDMAVEDEFTKQWEYEFSYDSEGRLILQESDDGSTIACDYDSKGDLSSITRYGTTYTFTDSDEGPDDPDIVMVRDKDGNVIKKIFPDGSYSEYTYQKFRLSKEEAQLCRNMQMGLHQVSAIGRTLGMLGYTDYYYAFLQYVPFPTTERLNFDIITRKD